MSEFGKGIPLASGFDLGAKIPLDSRIVVETLADRDAHVTGNRVYEGMRVYVKENKKNYQYIDGEWKDADVGSNVDLNGYVTKEDFDNLEKIETSDTEPTDEDVTIWIDTSETMDIEGIPRINDNVIADNTTWSSEKIDSVMKNIDSSQIDLSGYATKEELNGLASEGYVTEIVNSLEKIETSDTEPTNEDVTIWIDTSETMDIEEIARINDGTVADNTTWSSEKILEEINNVTPQIDLSEYAKKTELFSKDYNDLTNKPTIPSIEGLATENYVKNEIAKAQLEDTEIDLSGYATRDELNTKANISDIPTKISDLTNDSGYLTEHQDISHLATKTELFSKDYNDLTNKPTIPSINGLASEEYVDNAIDDIVIPTKVSQLENDNNYLTNIPSEYITETELNNMGYLTEHQDISHLATKTELFSKDYNDLTNKPNIPSIEGLASESYVDNEIAEVINSTEAISSSDTQPTDENISIWINTSEDTATNPLTRINDDTIARNTTWSSEKIDNTIKNNLISDLKLVKEGNTIKLMLGDIELSNISID